MSQINSAVIRPIFQKTLIDQNDTNNIYIGRAKTASLTSAAVWQITLVTTDINNVTSFLFANGAPTFVNIWDNRVSLSYS